MMHGINVNESWPIEGIILCGVPNAFKLNLKKGRGACRDSSRVTATLASASSTGLHQNSNTTAHLAFDLPVTHTSRYMYPYHG